MPGYHIRRELCEGTRRRLLAAAAILALFATAMLVHPSASGAGASAGASAATAAPIGDPTEFRHTDGQHARLPCLLCHQRREGVTTPIWPGHSPCAGCHAQQFANVSSPICAVCHTDTGTGALKRFPRIESFGATFDHARHQRGAARPRAGCVACHRSDRLGKGYSIPARLGAHAICFTCHAPKAQAAGRDISSCGTCHQLGAPPRAVGGVGAYKVHFAHAAHGRAGVKCAECHTIRSAGRGKQVVRPTAQQHRSIGGSISCGRCHDGKRAFGGDDFTVCSRCHRGDAWKF